MSNPRTKLFSRSGFTITEIIIVVAILAVIAAIAIASALAFVGYGRYENRMNVARTIYLAAQNQLTRSKAEKNLKSTLTGRYYLSAGGLYTTELDPAKIELNNVASRLGGSFPDPGNEDYVRYISKPAGYAPTGSGGELDSFYLLLEQVILDKSILNGAILMEYNIETGIVMSIFYSDRLSAGESFDYLGASGADNNVEGGRGMDGGYEYARSRNQGYYGVGSTGEAPPANLQDIVNIYDGINRPLDSGGAGSVNILYVELLLAKGESGALESGSYSLELINDKSSDSVVSYSAAGLDSPFLPQSLEAALMSGGEIIYLDPAAPTVEQHGVDLGAYYNRYIWVIDYVGGDMPQGQPGSVSRYGLALTPQNVRARIIRDTGAQAVSLSAANTHFNGELSGGVYEIRSARHLSNIRCAPDADFRQTADIDISPDADNGITNFAPIERFGGSYFAMESAGVQYRITGLRITSALQNVGLFSEIDTSGTIQGLALFGAEITSTGGGNTGAVAGLVTSGTIRQCYSYADVTSSGANDGSNTGGLVGQIVSGTLDQSFNAGFFDAHSQPASSGGIGSVSASAGNIGGLAGSNGGAIQNCFNNARVNVDSVTYDPDGGLSHTPVPLPITARAYLGGIAGLNTGTINNVYATNYVAAYPEYGSATGGIAGYDAGGISARCFFIGNGCTGDTSVSKEELAGKFIDVAGGAFTGGRAYVEGNNRYTQYPYPVLKNNDPFSLSGPGWDWGWEDIRGIDAGAGLLYYERYDNGAFGYSGSDDEPLYSAPAGLVTNDGYVLQFNYVSAMEIIIDGRSYILTDTAGNDKNPRWEWSGNNPNPNPANVPVAFTAVTDGEQSVKYRLFFENSFLESLASGAVYIDFEVKVMDETTVSVRFNPLFADTVGGSGGNFIVRSPRHLDNIDEAPQAGYTQRMNIDFDVYRRELARITQTSTMSSLALSGEKITFLDGNRDTTVITGEFSGSFNGAGLYTRGVEAQIGLFDTVTAGASVTNMVLRESQFTGHWNGMTGKGGIARQNSGSISGCLVLQTDFSGGYHHIVGGIAGHNTGTISGCGVEGSTVSGGAGHDIGGISGVNEGAIVGSTVKAARIGGGGGVVRVGGVAGINAGTISGCTVEAVDTLTGQDSVGGIAGENSGEISGSRLVASSVTGINGGSSGIGGIAGHNSGSVRSSGVLYSTVISQGHTSGGIVGVNNSLIDDVFFLSVNDTDNAPVAAAAWGRTGGITGINNGDLSHALYLAPAPASTDWDGSVTIFPITGELSDKDGDSTCFYLSGYRYSLNEGKNWTTSDYNRIREATEDTPSVSCDGGGTGLVSKFIDLEWLNFVYDAAFAGWHQPSSGYPYPMLSDMSAPLHWPEADSPARPEQEDRDDWAEIYETSGRAATLNFLNGGFTDMYSQAGVPTGETSTGGATGTTYFDSRHIRQYVDFLRGGVIGWRTRPVNAADADNIENTYIEFQEPINNSRYGGQAIPDWGWITESWHGWNGYMYTDYRGRYHEPPDVTGAGGVSYRYAELNATLPGTLYQVSATTPGTQYMYSFYHTAALAQFTGGAWVKNTYQMDRMNFYLSGVTEGAVQAHDDSLTLIRPCWSPRQVGTSSAQGGVTRVWGAGSRDSRWNPAAKNTVSYTKSEMYDNGRYDLSYYRERFDDFPADNRPFLYDVWITDLGYGVTFWSESEISGIPTAGVPSSHVIYTANSGHIIGYWGVSYGWKHYYGLYTVPEGQVNTEFAYQSREGSRATAANYLSGVGFKSPAFLSVDIYSRDKDGAGEVKFVTLGDTVTFEMNVRNWGEIPAGSIVVENQLQPFEAYVEFIEGSVRIDGATPAQGTTVSAPSAANGHTLKIEFPDSYILKRDETVQITFQVRVRQTVIDGRVDSGVETLLYYFKNQAQVSYYDYSYENENTGDYFPIEAYSKSPMPAKTNASEVAQVYIDPIKLEKKAEPQNGTGLIDGPFRITLTISNTLEGGGGITTHGIVSDLIPKGFVISDYGNLPSGGFTSSQNADGTTRLTIRDVALGDPGEGYASGVSFWYAITYAGEGYGTLYTNTSADYKYIYKSETTADLSVMLTFPQPVVGISVKTAPDVYSISGAQPHSFDITANDSFKERFFDANYSVMPEVVLTDAHGNPAAKNASGNYMFETDRFTAELLSGSNFLRFTPKRIDGTDVSGNFTLYYRIMLTATKEGSASFELSSSVTGIEISVVGDDIPVYYEKYGDGSYGFYAAQSAYVPLALDDTKDIAEYGYGVLSARPGIGGFEETVTVSVPDGGFEIYLYKLSSGPSADLTPLTLLFDGEAIGKYHPSFAKAVYPPEAEDAGTVFYIRTETQRDNINLLSDVSGLTFTAERGIDLSPGSGGQEG